MTVRDNIRRNGRAALATHFQDAASVSGGLLANTAENALVLFCTRLAEQPEAEAVYMDVIDMLDALPVTVGGRIVPVSEVARRECRSVIRTYLEDMQMAGPGGTSVSALADSAERALACFGALFGEQAETIYAGIVDIVQTMPVDNALLTLDDVDGLHNAFRED